MVQLQPGGKASNADCIAPGTNLVQDLRYIQLSKDLTLYLVSGSQGNPGRKNKKCHRKWHCDSEDDILHPESLLLCWGALLQVNPRLWVLTAPCCKILDDTCHKNSSIYPGFCLYYKLRNYPKVLVALIAYGSFFCTSFPLVCVMLLALL